jgi:hypothetical protein
MGICVFMADIFVEPTSALEGEERRPQELHRFLVHFADGRRLETPEEKRWVPRALRLVGLALPCNTCPSSGRWTSVCLSQHLSVPRGKPEQLFESAKTSSRGAAAEGGGGREAVPVPDGNRSARSNHRGAECQLWAS